MFDFYYQWISTLPEEYRRYLMFLPLLFIGFLATLLLAPIIGKIAFKFGITYKPHEKRKGKEFDNPEKHIHDRETPIPGGLAITIPLFIFILVFFKLDSVTIPFMFAFGVLIISSALDDIFNLPAIAQALAQIVAASIIAFSVVDLAFVNNPFGGIINLDWAHLSFDLFGLPMNFVFPGDLILIAFIGVCINAMKWVGGSPGLMESNSLIAFLMLFLIGVRTFSEFVSASSIFVVGALFGLLFYAFPPQKIFSGSSFKSISGFLIAVFAIINGSKFATGIMILLLPLADFLYVIIKRYIAYRPRNPLQLIRINDTNHLHHQLLGLGLSARQVLMAETSITLFIGAIAVFSTGTMKFFAILIFGFLLLGGISLTHILRGRKAKKDAEEKAKQTPESKYVY